MRNRKREIDSLTDFKRQMTEYLEQRQTAGKPVMLTGNVNTHVVHDAPQIVLEPMMKAGIEEMRAALREGLFDVAAGRTKPAKTALKALAKKFKCLPTRACSVKGQAGNCRPVALPKRRCLDGEL